MIYENAKQQYVVEMKNYQFFYYLWTLHYLLHIANKPNPTQLIQTI